MQSDSVKSAGQKYLGDRRSMLIPAIIADAGERVGKRFIEFFTATIRNGITRRAYARAVSDFLAWYDGHRLAELLIRQKPSAEHRNPDSIYLRSGAEFIAKSFFRS